MDDGHKGQQHQSPRVAAESGQIHRQQIVGDHHGGGSAQLRHSGILGGDALELLIQQHHESVQYGGGETLRNAAEIEAAEKDESKTRPFDMQLEALLPVIRREIPLKAHAHRADDILTALRIAKEFDVDITLDHVTEGHLIVDQLVEAKRPVLVGPSFGSKSKFELKEKSFETPGILSKAGLDVCIITDAPVIPLNYLPLCAGLAVREGMDEDAAWRAITINPAKVAGIADRVGSLEVGKDADLAIWSGDPLRDIQARAQQVFVNGEPVL